MMAMDRVVVRYHEVALKGGNRAAFVRQLTQNILRTLRGTGVGRARPAPGRIILTLPSADSWPEVRQRMRRVFGIAKFLLSEPTPPCLDTLTRAVVDAVAKRSFRTFAVRTKRSDKTFPVLSPEISRIIGQAVCQHTGSSVDLTAPELEIHVEVLPREMLFSVEKVDGPGGLPIGTGGTAVALLSGGIDSPVAAHRIMQRGCQLEFVHFHGAPFQSRASRDKARDLLEVLTRWQPDTRLHLVPFGLVQRQIVTSATRRLRVVLYRRMMIRIAQAIAAQVGAIALVTGDSLGQVASQTLPNLAAIEDASVLPILRPLIGMDKQEITEQARRLGTYTISIQPDEDCCRLFVPKHPATRTTAAEVRAAEQPLDTAALTAGALEQSEVVELSFPAGAPTSTARRVPGLN